MSEAPGGVDLALSLPDARVTNVDRLLDSRAFCMVPWVHLFVSHFGTVVPCCLTPWDREQALGDANRQTLGQIWNGQPIRDLRLKMIRDEPDPRCAQCHEGDRLGLRSKRRITNALYAEKFDWVRRTRADGHAAEAAPVSWDLRYSNLCNFRCRICGHHSSSAWYDDALELGQLAHPQRVNRGVPDFESLLAQLSEWIDGVEEVYFAGGEPLLMEEHYRLLDRLLAAGRRDVKLRYSTNFSQLRWEGRDVLELWSQFEDVHVHASLDDSGPRGELQRKGQSWARTLENRERMLAQVPHVDFMLTPTISVFNVLRLPELHREWTRRGLIAVDAFMPHTLRSPRAYSLRVLPPPLKRDVEAATERHLEWIADWARRSPPPAPRSHSMELADHIRRIAPPAVTGHVKLDMVCNEFRGSVAFMHSGDDTALLPEFRRMCADLDRLRGEDTRSVFPELAPLFEVDPA